MQLFTVLFTPLETKNLLLAVTQRKRKTVQLQKYTVQSEIIKTVYGT